MTTNSVPNMGPIKRHMMEYHMRTQHNKDISWVHHEKAALIAEHEQIHIDAAQGKLQVNHKHS